MKRGLAVRGALMLGGLLCGLLLVEIGLRIVTPVPTENLLPFPYRHDDLARIASGDAYLQFDQELGWATTPAAAREESGALYRTNQAGMRAERDYQTVVPPGVRRIAAFGDSFTHCDEVNNSECWTAELERRSSGTEVLNFGVPGFAPDQAWLRYRRDGRPYQPCAVLIGYMVENINRVVSRFFPFYQPATGIVLSKPRFVLDGDGLALLPNPAAAPAMLDDPRWVEAALGPSDRWFFPGLFVGGPLDAFQVVRTARTAAYHRHAQGRGGFDVRFLRAYGTGAAWGGMGDDSAFDEQLARAYRADGEALQTTARVLSSFAREVRSDGAAPVVVVFGRRQEAVASRRGTLKYYAPLLEALAREGVTALDTSDWLAQEAQRFGMEQLFGSRGHYSARVNQLLGARLARELPALVAPTCGTGPQP